MDSGGGIPPQGEPDPHGGGARVNRCEGTPPSGGPLPLESFVLGHTEVSTPVVWGCDDDR